MNEVRCQRRVSSQLFTRAPVTQHYSKTHKVHSYKEYHNVCPLPPEPKGGGHTRVRVRGWGSPNSNDWRKSLALCLLCGKTGHLQYVLAIFARKCVTVFVYNSMNFIGTFKMSRSVTTLIIVYGFPGCRHLHHAPRRRSILYWLCLRGRAAVLAHLNSDLSYITYF